MKFNPTLEELLINIYSNLFTISQLNPYEWSNDRES